MRNAVRALVLAGTALLAACGSRPAGPAPLERVAAVATPAPAAMVASYKPTGTVETLAQIRVIFRDDLIPLQRLESDDERAILDNFSVSPALPGHFRFLTPRMVGFQADAALPLATRVRVTIAKGIRDTAGHELSADFSWTFATDRIAISGLPLQDDAKAEPQPGPLLPRIALTSNVALDLASLAAHAALVPSDGGARVALAVPPNTATPAAAASDAPDAAFDPSNNTYGYTLVPAGTLAKATTYDVVVDQGVEPKRGNLPSDASFRGKLATFAPLRFTGLQPDTSDTDRLASGVPTLAFDNPIDPKTIAAAVHLSPAAAAGTLAASIGADSSIALNPALLAPNTTYTVTIDATLTDTFGQTLGQPETATFTTGNRSPQLWAPEGTHLFPSSLDVQLDATTVNQTAGSTTARFTRLQPADVVTNDDPASDGSPLLAPRPWPAFAVAGARNAETTTHVPLRALTGGAGVLAYGISGRTGTTTDQHGATVPSFSTYVGLVALTNLGAFAQWFPDGGFVRVDHLADGAPAPNVSVEVYRSQTSDATKSPGAPPCARATTGTDGIARFAGDGYARCAALDAGKNEAPALVTIVREGNDWTYVRTDDSAGAYGAGIYAGWSSATPISRGTIFSDRQLYQRGETAQLTVVGWFLTQGVLARGTAPSYTIVLQQPDDTKMTLRNVSLNAYGTASLTIPIARDAPLGYYTVHATGGNGEELYGDFRVAAFKPPNFKVALALSRATASAGGTVTANATSTYLFGSPVQGATTQVDVTREIASYTWPADPAYSFGRQWFWPEDQPSISSDVSSTPASVNADGVASATVTVAADLPYPMTYRVDAETTDVSNLSVADTKSFTAYPGSVQIGLKNDFVATAGSATTIHAIALDPDGKPVPGTAMHLALQRAVYSSATQVVEGSDTAQESVTYTTVAETNVTSASAPVDASLTPPVAGTYRITANVAGANGDATETDVELYVTGAGGTSWLARDPNRLDIHLDKKTYRPGERARAVIASPFPDADILVAVVRSGVMWQQRIRTHGSAPAISFPIDATMLPNAAFEAIAVRRGTLPADTTPGAGNALVRTGFATFAVALDAKYLTVTATPVHATLKPGQHQTVRLHLTDRAKRAVQGQITLIVANDAVLQLSGYRPPDLVKLVYAEQPISTRFADNRLALVLKTMHETADKGWGYGGGLSGGPEDTRIRHNFQPLAYYAGALLTDANGDVSASFDLPDDLTTWRVMAVAATTDGRFGNGESTFVTAKPLMANPVMPQFARPGDRFDAGATVTTTGDVTNGTVAIEAQLTSPLAFLVNGARVPDTSLSAPLDRITKAYRFPIVATGTGTSTTTFVVKATRVGTTANDAFAIPVPVYDRAVTESVVTTGVSANASTSLPLAVAGDTPRDAGGLQLILANSLIPDAIVAARPVFAGHDFITLDGAARLGVAADLLRLIALTNATGPAPDARAQATAALAFLAPLQRSDGGFAGYAGATSSDPFDSLAVLHVLARARGSGIAVDPGMRARAHAFAATALADPGAWKWCKKDPCRAELRLHALDALADDGDTRSSFLDDIDAARDGFCLADRLRLARRLLLTPGYAARGEAEARAIGERVYETGALATINVPSRYAWLGAPVVMQSLATQLFAAQHADPATIDRLTRALLGQRKNGSWGCACENLAALDALVDVAAAAGPPPDLQVTATRGAASLARATFAGHRASAVTVETPARSLAVGTVPVLLAKAGAGALHYALTYTYRLAGPQAGQLAGLRITRIVHAAGTSAALVTMGLSPTAPVSLAVARVFDIELQIVTDHPVDRVTIADALPAGLEAVDTSFATTSAAIPALDDSWQIDDQQIEHDRVTAYADHLGPGIYVMHYIARSVTPGTFAWPGAEARLVTRPEEFGRSAATTVTIH